MSALATATDEARDEVTLALAQQASTLEFAALPDDIVAIAKQCLTDWFAVTLAGAAEPLVTILHEELAAPDGPATLVGLSGRAGPQDAATINGAASHALDFDDVNLMMHGHPTVPIVPALLALAEVTGATGQDVLAAFVAGYEVECRIGSLVDRSHYDAGFHATATIGSFGAAAAAARLLGLDTAQTAMALGIAGTQAAGLKSMFGTMCKPLHAGKAAANGLLAARLAARGFTSRSDVLEAEQGFADTQATAFRPERALATPSGGYHLRNNLFKYHAACYLTHSSIEALSHLRTTHQLRPDDVATARLRIDAGHLKVCGIEAPTTGLETKFSLHHTAAFALAGMDTAALETYSDENANRPDLIALRQKVTLDPQTMPGTAATATIVLDDGREISQDVNVGVPADDVSAQSDKIAAKYHSLADPVLGTDKARALQAAIKSLDQANDITGVMAAAALA